MKVHTETVHFKADRKLIDFIEDRLSRMDRYHDRFIDAQVTLKLENSGQVKDKVAEVKVNVPGEALFAKNTEKSFEAAVDAAINSLRRQLRKYKDRLRNV